MEFLQTEWRTWPELPWTSRGGVAGDVQVCLRLVQGVAEFDALAEYLRSQLPEIASEFAASWIGVVRRGSQWERLAEFGRQPLETLPVPLLLDALDRDSGVWTSFSTTDGPWGLAAIPLHKGGTTGEVMIVCGRGLPNRLLLAIMAAARTLGLAMELIRQKEAASRRAERLRSTLHIASQLGSTRETVPLLELIASEAARLLGCDRSSIFIWDKEHHEVVACPALGVPGNMLRLPDNVGVVGDCIQTGQALRVDDAYQDPRFNKDVDLKTGYRTRNLLCVPLVDAEDQRIGAFEVINRATGRFTDDDELTLRELGLQVATALQNTRERETLVRRNEQLTAQVAQAVQIIGDSAAIVALRATIGRLAATDLPVLILGESGTGKEVVAQALHYQGPRRNQPFIAVNCAALTETLLESELFGHERGAFTDAHEARQGKFELADGGTLFLDEIGDMSPGGQAKLLRVLEQKVVTRVGGSQPIRINVRVVAATNANLAAKVREKKFREDLYYRLSVVTLELPPLRDRPEDILALAEFFLDRFARQASRPRMGLAQDARRRLQAHGWPGNIRELRNLMERVAFLCPRDRVEAEDLAFVLSPDRDPAHDGSTDAGLAEATAHFQQDYIRRMIKRVRGNMSQAAELLGLHRSNLYRKMRQLKMREVEGSTEGDDVPTPENDDL